MNQVFEHFEQPDKAFTEVEPDEQILLEYLTLPQDRDELELGILQFDPTVLATAVELPHHSRLKPE